MERKRQGPRELQEKPRQKGRSKKRALEFLQRRVALERLGDGARIIIADVVVGEAVYAFAKREGERGKQVSRHHSRTHEGSHRNSP